MKLVKILGVITALAGLVALAVVVAPSVYGQSARPNPSPSSKRQLQIFGGGSQIGASVRDLEDSEMKEGRGVYVESVRPDGPAARAGLQAADIVTRFDGESVRSLRQFSRLVQETPSGRTVAVSVLRQGRATELSLTPEAGSNAGVFLDGDRLRGMIDEQRLQERLAEAQERIKTYRFPPFDFDLDLPFSGLLRRSRLGVSVEELTPQLAAYFGAKDGVLIASVDDNSSASRAGLKAGDVIVSVNGQNVASSNDLVRALRAAGADADVTLGIVRDKRETSVRAKLDDVGTSRPRRQIRPVRATPA